MAEEKKGADEKEKFFHEAIAHPDHLYRVAWRSTWRKIKIVPKTWYKKPLFELSLLTISLIPEQA